MWTLFRRKQETWNMEKVEVINDFLSSVFTGICSSYTTSVAEGKDRDCENDEPPTVGDQVQDHLRNLNMHISVGPDEMHPRLLRELSNEVSKLLSIIFEKSWQPVEVKINSDWKIGSIALTY